MIKGIPFDFGNCTLIVPPLSLGDFETMEERIKAFGDEQSSDNNATVIDCLALALKRNYPDMTRADAGALVDLGNMQDVMFTVMDANGIRRKKLEAGESWGEVMAPPKKPTGAASTQG